MSGIMNVFSPGCDDCCCKQQISIYGCCGWVDCPEPDLDEPGGPFPVFFVLDANTSGCFKIVGGTIVITRTGMFNVTITETSLNWSYQINGGSPIVNDPTPQSVSVGDVISGFTMHSIHCDQDCAIVGLNYGNWAGTPPNLSAHICFGITYSGTAPDITSTVDCESGPIDCGG